MAAGSGERIGGIVGVVEGGGFLNVIASVSEAIHAATPRMDCVVASAPRNDEVGFHIRLSNSDADVIPHPRGAMHPRYAFFPPSKTEGAGNAGCALHPRSRVQ